MTYRTLNLSFGNACVITLYIQFHIPACILCLHNNIKVIILYCAYINAHRFVDIRDVIPTSGTKNDKRGYYWFEGKNLCTILFSKWDKRINDTYCCGIPTKYVRAQLFLNLRLKSKKEIPWSQCIYSTDTGSPLCLEYVQLHYVRVNTLCDVILPVDVLRWRKAAGKKG